MADRMHGRAEAESAGLRGLSENGFHPTARAEQPILEVEGLFLSFVQYGAGLRQRNLEVIHDLSLSAHAGEVVAVVGASGSGKSLLAHALFGILPNNATVEGSMRFRGEELVPSLQEKLRGSKMAFVPQSVDYLDPLMKTGAQVRGIRASAERARNALDRFGLDERVDALYPFELSGGMARRVLVATAVVEDADLIVADEPTPGMTLGMAKEAMKTFREFADAGKAVVVITHDLDLACSTADRIVVFYAGQTSEIADAADFRDGGARLRHPYSKALVKALPQNEFEPVGGTQPYADNLPVGCLFAPRCAFASSECTVEHPPLRAYAGGQVRCLHPLGEPDGLGGSRSEGDMAVSRTKTIEIGLSNVALPAEAPLPKAEKGVASSSGPSASDAGDGAARVMESSSSGAGDGAARVLERCSSGIGNGAARVLGPSSPEARGESCANPRLFGGARAHSASLAGPRLLEARNVTFAYKKGAPVLENVSFGMREGEIVGLYGPSGRGKSTLAYLLSGRQKPQSGLVLWDGARMPTRGYHPIQLVYQHPERAINPRWQLGKTLGESWDPPKELQDALGIEEAWKKRWPNELSGGELQRFCIARALNPQTRILICDEITTMLDVITQAQVWRAIVARARETGMGVIAITHNLELANRICDRIVEL